MRRSQLPPDRRPETNVIVRARALHGGPVTKFAADCGVSVTTVHDWTRAGYVTKLEHALAIVDAVRDRIAVRELVKPSARVAA